jgi:predicted dithiol-disulfide oxidoreductase (DUF899 family)
VKSVAEKRRKLPPGGLLKEDYVFQWANDGKVGESVRFSELFGDKNTLWPAAGFVDTEIGCFMKPEVADATTEVRT